MSTTMVRKPERREPGEITEFDEQILGKTAVRLHIPVRQVADTLEALRMLHRVTERAILVLEASKIAEDRSALFTVKTLLRQAAMSISKVKVRRF